MQKKTIFIILIVAVLAVSILSIYSSFAYNEESHDLGDTDANYNLIYSLKDENSRTLTVPSRSDLYVDLDLTNAYDYTVKYAAYYYLTSPNSLPAGVIVSRVDEREDDTIKAHDNETISLKIVNGSDYNIDLIVGTLVGFENGNIEDLLTDGMVLVK